MNLIDKANKNIYIADKISYFRTKKDLTQEQLADLLGVSKQSVSNWETGLKFPRYKIISKLADIFNVNVTELIADDYTSSTCNLGVFVGNRIKLIRKNNGLTQEDLAMKLGLTRQSISRYETGERKVNIDLLYELAKVLSVPIDIFFPSKSAVSITPDFDETFDIGQAMNDLLDKMYCTEDVTFFDNPLNEPAKDSLKIAIQMALELNKGRRS